MHHPGEGTPGYKLTDVNEDKLRITPVKGHRVTG